MSHEQLHEPTANATNVASTTAHHSSSGGVRRASPAPASSKLPTEYVQTELARLSLQRDEVSLRLSTFSSVLMANDCDMTTTLVDRQGFPRADIDVAGVRTARANIIMLRNDLRHLQAQIEQLVLRGLPRRQSPERKSADAIDVDVTTSSRSPAFARINRIFPGGPADAAGIKTDDLLLRIGDIDATNHSSLQAVAALVSTSQDVVLDIRIRRAEHDILLRLVPKTGWGGRGLLGVSTAGRS
ncbi:BQ2448_6190 [Microbotryum intermedium]|uniref:Probable 26S proteasome regulatory subunit p27 n=1 Tax=Microbotryum intermedium TaxID=269621 RepID=A0A238FIZ8_9BASI|nr:BQ2448_6190 [Microbotryum intermedium]